MGGPSDGERRSYNLACWATGGSGAKGYVGKRPVGKMQGGQNFGALSSSLPLLAVKEPL